ncbi:MAG: hypothetical protein H6Q31_254 [Bacteroidetes bacterium]|nr:hypothetical protein [Bacteroidota bacterium]
MQSRSNKQKKGSSREGLGIRKIGSRPASGRRSPRNALVSRAGEAAGVCTVLSHALEDRRQIFLRQLARARRRASEPAIHDLRVALRRLIAALDLAAVVVPGTGIRNVRRSLRSSLKQFNTLRDVHIALLAMRGMRTVSPPVRSYSASLRVRERSLLRECAGTLRSLDVRDLDRELARIQQTLLTLGTDRHLDVLTGAMIKGNFARTVARALVLERAVTAADASSVHRLRVAFKRVRYASEILAPLLPWITRPRRKWMQAYQTMMGEVQDCEVMLAGVRRFAARPSIRNRISVLPLQEMLARRKRERIDAFMQHAAELEKFWEE